MEQNKRDETAFLAMGCFWEPDLLFSKLPGVVSATVGYSGGQTKNPTYDQVCSGRTGHAETVKVVFDPNRISYRKILETFFAHHDPTTKNRQGPDVGEQYRSAIFYLSQEQEKIAQELVAELTDEGRFGAPIVTEIAPAGEFYEAEYYHQDYLAKRGKTTCSI